MDRHLLQQQRQEPLGPRTRARSASTPPAFHFPGATSSTPQAIPQRCLSTQPFFAPPSHTDPEVAQAAQALADAGAAPRNSLPFDGPVDARIVEATSEAQRKGVERSLAAFPLVKMAQWVSHWFAAQVDPAAWGTDRGAIVIELSELQLSLNEWVGLTQYDMIMAFAVGQAVIAKDPMAFMAPHGVLSSSPTHAFLVCSYLAQTLSYDDPLTHGVWYVFTRIPWQTFVNLAMKTAVLLQWDIPHTHNDVVQALAQIGFFADATTARVAAAVNAQPGPTPVMGPPAIQTMPAPKATKSMAVPMHPDRRHDPRNTSAAAASPLSTASSAMLSSSVSSASSTPALYESGYVDVTMDEYAMSPSAASVAPSWPMASAAASVVNAVGEFISSLTPPLAQSTRKSARQRPGTPTGALYDDASNPRPVEFGSSVYLTE